MNYIIMKEFTGWHTLEIEAENDDEAVEKMLEAYDDSDQCLTAADCIPISLRDNVNGGNWIWAIEGYTN